MYYYYYELYLDSIIFFFLSKSKNNPVMPEGWVICFLTFFKFPLHLPIYLAVYKIILNPFSYAAFTTLIFFAAKSVICDSDKLTSV